MMEPESRLYTSPVIVLDFQSLYPSMVIAYNLCFSTCLGRPRHHNQQQQGPRLGIKESYAAPPGLLAKAGLGPEASRGKGQGARCVLPSDPSAPLEGARHACAIAWRALVLLCPTPEPRGNLQELVVSPNGVAFSPPSHRPGVLPRLLREILETRVMVKGAMKRAPQASVPGERKSHVGPAGLPLPNLFFGG